MKLWRLVLRNLRRSKFRVLFTICAVATAVIAFVLLNVIQESWNSRSTNAVMDRLMTQDAISYAVLLPHRYVDEIRALPHVKSVTFMNWLGGRIATRPSESFGSFAVDADTFFETYSDVLLAPDVSQRWHENHQGAVVGEVLAHKMGWKLGDHVALESGFYPEQAEWQFEIVGIYATRGGHASRSNLYFRWDYFNELVGTWHRDSVGWVITRVAEGTPTATVANSIDAHFADHGQQTFTQNEKAFESSMREAMNGTMAALDLASGGILLVLVMLIGNTISMAVRERTKEYGTLRAIGFMPGQLALFVLAETALLAVLGSLLGIGLSVPLIGMILGRWVESNVDTFLPHFQVGPRTAVIVIVANVVVAAIAAALPARRVFRIRVVEALRQVV